MNKSTLIIPRDIGVETMKAWLASGAIVETSRGEENVYFMDEFGYRYFCKCL